VGGDDAAGISTDLLSQTYEYHETRLEPAGFPQDRERGHSGRLAAGAPRQILAADQSAIRPTADTVIVLWMAGGMAHTETFDPKRYVPFSKGMPASDMLSTFPQIDTAVDHIKLSQGLEKIAAVMDRGTLIRSYTAGDLGFILHTAINTNGTPVTRRRKPSPARTSARSSRARSARKIPPCPRLLTSGSASMWAKARN
jgi:hypothetical protein